MRDESGHERTLLPFLQQLDIDGNLHDLEPKVERFRLVEPDVQLPGQAWL
jgi:hypothetical protein